MFRRQALRQPPPGGAQPLGFVKNSGRGARFKPLSCYEFREGSPAFSRLPGPGVDIKSS